MLTHGAFEDPEFIKCSQWLDKFRTEYQRVIVNDLWYNRFPPSRGHASITTGSKIKGHKKMTLWYHSAARANPCCCGVLALAGIIVFSSAFRRFRNQSA